MQAIARSLMVVLVALMAVPVLVVTATISTAVQLVAATALIMGGTEHPLSPPTDDSSFVTAYMNQAIDNYIDPDGTPVPDNPTEYNRVAVIYPAEFFPVFGSRTFDESVDEGVDNLGSCLGRGPSDSCNYNPSVDSLEPNPETDQFIVFGYSQSAVVASLVKNQIIEDNDISLDGTAFYLISNPMRPNGGILARGGQGTTIPLLGVTFEGPTQNSCPPAGCTEGDDLVTPTVDVAQQYDFLGGDAPARTDPVAFGNSLAAYTRLHGDMPTRSIELDENGIPKDRSIIYQGRYGDTDYYLVTARRLPLLIPAENALDAVCGCGFIVNLPDALLRVWIEDKYRRDLSPGEHVQTQVSPIGNPPVLLGNMLGAVQAGMDDTVADATGNPDNRPLGTNNVYRPFGVGGPVYDKETGERVEDNVGIPTGAGDYEGAPPVTQQQTLAGNQDEIVAGTNNDARAEDKTPDASGRLGPSELARESLNFGTRARNNNDAGSEDKTPDAGELPAAKRPRPSELVRESLNFTPSKRPSLSRPGADRPLKRLVNALTGQPPKATADSENGDDQNPTAGSTPTT